MSIDKEELDSIAEFKVTMELQWLSTTLIVETDICRTTSEHRVLQQKWTNELGESEWRDIPLVMQG